MPTHPINGLKCKITIDELMKKRIEKAQTIILLRAELKIAKWLKKLYVKELTKWTDRENELNLKILKIENKLRA